MGNVVITSFITLDGVIESPETWSFDYQSEDTGARNKQTLFASDVLLLGRITYEGFAQAWPGREDPDGFADKMNSVRKVVVSSSLTEADWNNSEVASGDLGELVARLKGETEGDILVWGSATLARSLIEADLVDAYELLVNPVIAGGGKRLFPDDGTKRALRRTDATPLSGGMTALRLEPVRDAG